MANDKIPTKNCKVNANVNSADISEEQRRIWVGNLDSRITEFQLLKLMQKCGAVEKFDMLFHKGGPMVGQSRGYAFITFKKNEGATNALIKLDGSNIGSRSIAVRLAKNIKYDDLQRPKPRLEIPALGRGKREDKISKSDAIRAIEAKLRTLERQTDNNLELNIAREENIPFIYRYQFNKSRDDTPHTRPHGKYNKPKPSASYLRQLPNRR
ncbi:PREDICTED: probable RNA-binding protein 18 isoform X1 [Drosophila arizonae]|uniref:Probable RNA-binding protein 18 n=2 Tax=Drosophila arizonae TaxID=7263 RepID=A0ABM1PPD1_DROAR|nr:PREDICTED: probable RNA-binding protein 18 isoform X1 [Drosophila arizonae]